MEDNKKVPKKKKSVSMKPLQLDSTILVPISDLKELEELKHKNRMEGLRYARETDKIRHEQEMERQRIKSAEIRKTHERKEAARYAREYSKDLGWKR